MPAKHQKFTIDVPNDLTADDRDQLADDVIEFIKQRTEQGRDVDGDKFPGYSESYIKSLAFKIGGKSPRSVDLTLSGDMLAAIEVLESKRGKIVIGFQAGSPENDRADGNIRGSYGGSPNPKRARPFLGIADKDLDKLLSFYQKDDDEKKDE